MQIFSYTNIAKNLTSIDIFNLGIRSYLDGNVSNPKPIGIEYWSKYSVKDNKYEFIVILPILHILLQNNTQKLDTKTLFLELVKCNCAYFCEFGNNSDGVICKHIVAVAQKVQKDYLEIEGKAILKPKLAEKSVLDNFFEAELSVKTKKLQQQFDSYFAKSETQNIYWFEQFIFIAKKETQQYSQFLSNIKQVFLSQIKDYDQEKKLYYLMTSSLRLGGLFWWNFWQEFIPYFSQRQQLRLWSEVWRNRFSRLTSEYDTQINNYIQQESDEYKQKILDKLKEDYENNADLWLDFVMSSKYEKFLVENLSKFDPELLLEICDILPKKREEIEIKIMNHIKIWSDYTMAGDYSELEKVLTKWSVLGKSDYFYEATKHIKTAHKKKSKLMLMIRRLEER